MEELQLHDLKNIEAVNCVKPLPLRGQVIFAVYLLWKCSKMLAQPSMMFQSSPDRQQAAARVKDPWCYILR